MTITSSNYQFTYTPHYKPNQLICGYGQTAIITGWTVKQSVAKHLNPEDYAVIGNLYSPTRGISPLIRNLLANPHVRFLVILQATKEDKNAGGCQCLLDFLQHGFTQGKSDTGRDTWVINSEITGYIDIEIDADALENLRQYLDYKEAKSIREAVDYIKEFADQNNKQPWGNPLIFPQLETTLTVLPGPRYGHRIEGKTIAETWVKILHRIKTTGTIRPTGYDGKWQELIDLTAVITNEPAEVYFPDPNYLPIDRSFLKEYIPQILDDAPYTEGVKYTYGQRLRSWFKKDQIKQVINKLIGEIDAASGVMSLWDVNDHDKGGSPCLNHIWIRVVENELSLTATLRSNDMFAAWPANAMGLRALQQHIRDEIAKRSDYNLQMGPLITISQSAHIYDDTWENVDKLITNQYAKIINNRDYFDPSGNFLIEVEDGQIMVKQTTPGSGEIVACYSGKNSGKLIREICAASPAIQPDHIGYLGIELQKAYQCLKMGQQYIQDQ
ncbi:thymidylate synthase [Aphanothece sacrum]|uniref:Thymidylate synthase n=1 Tax=Aphanothece sacrum FPU1 TaxID=1920663 RepID=A0A401II35_APHSA|nr:thymidylate synthase [Aphanothece sacrum]GBF80972.1 thymidylate synthase [Aphanothece sacrum FPU1]GBF85279.1 thymidylate synthase [Aphanothece sacrum FPU3]